ncbi:hypothetical protein KIN20_025669 [Parelaphostrongylus tenuis]|uniref:Uncharacterized protein n=1 Tax=Parelaphostrongylus tenuis TaxID=148309 RepID=A0AAD5QXC2_PARTN|nr:hypothetical protein KIN20_025669 [Parelaphostrongylus tenuis]
MLGGLGRVVESVTTHTVMHQRRYSIPHLTLSGGACSDRLHYRGRSAITLSTLRRIDLSAANRQRFGASSRYRP